MLSKEVMFSKTDLIIIEEKFQNLLPCLHNCRQELLARLDKCTEEVKAAVKYLYISSPLSDIGNYSFDIFYDYASHGVYLWEKEKLYNKMPEEIFLNYVLHHRINEEEIAPCRKLFYSKTINRIKGMDVKNAALEINYWCAGEVAYQSADERTAAPITIYQSGFGRCGEESTFTVSALRSVGIPARQVYAPRWSHCDDNHAWVEVWCYGEWYFMGACEPEEILNRGWFTGAASRAMLIHSRYFTGLDTGSIMREEMIGKAGCVAILNHLTRYAVTQPLKVFIQGMNNKPMSGIKVLFKVLNYSEFTTIAEAITDQQGCVSINLGIGDILIHVIHGTVNIQSLLSTEKADSITITIPIGEQKNIITCFNQWIDFDITAPIDNPINRTELTSLHKENGHKKVMKAVINRRNKIEQFHNEPEVKEVLAKTHFDKRIEEIIELCAGNFQEIKNFLMEDDEEHAEVYKVKFLKQLTGKDYQDLKYMVIKEHFSYGMEYVNQYPEEIFLKYILNPRINTEPIMPYRAYISKNFTESEKEEFKFNPLEIWNYISDNIDYYEELEYPNLTTSPVGCLELKAGCEQSKKILFVAVCRTLGIPARLNPVDSTAEYYRDNCFSKLAKEERKAHLCIIPESEDVRWVYYHNWSLALLKNNDYQTLHLPVQALQDSMSLDLEEGEYRLITSNRLPNGNIFCKRYDFKLEHNRERQITLSMRSAKAEDMLVQIDLPDFVIQNSRKESIQVSEVLDGDRGLLVWLEEGKEPTEHILNEILENKEEFRNLKARLIFIVKDNSQSSNPKVDRILKELPNAQLFYDTFTGNIDLLARRMYVELDKLPLILIVSRGQKGLYATSGYNVGTAEMLLKIMNCNV